MIYYLILMFVLYGVFYYRYFLFFKLVSVLLMFYKRKIENDIKNNVGVYENKLQVQKIDDYVYTEYEIIINGRKYNIIYLDGFGFNNNFDREFCDQIDFDKRNRIVHCNISNSKMDILFDVTNIFRKFCLYFDSNLKLDVFIKYVFKKYGKQIDYNYNLVLYLNDSNFTECVYRINQDLCFVDLFK